MHGLPYAYSITFKVMEAPIRQLYHICAGAQSCRDLHQGQISIIFASQKLILTRLPSQRHLIWQD